MPTRTAIAPTARTRWFCPTPNCCNGSRAGARRRVSNRDGQPLHFHGQIAALTPHLENGDKELSFTHRLTLPGGENHSVADAKFFNRQPPLALVNGTFYLLRNAPPPPVLKYLARKPAVPVRNLSHRLLLHLRKTQANHGVDWEQLCVAHPAAPQFVFELLDDTVRLRLLAKSAARPEHLVLERPANGRRTTASSSPATSRKFSTTRASNRRSNGCANWIGSCRSRACGSATRMKIFSARSRARGPNARPRRNFSATRRFTGCSSRRASSSRGSSSRAAALTGWPSPPNGRPKDSNFPRPIWNGSPPRPAASSNCRIPAGWNSTPTAVQGAHEAMAEMGVEGLIAVPQKVGMEHVAHLDEDELARFADSPEAKALRERVREFKGVPSVELPKGLQAELRPYQKDGFDFLCHLTQIRLGGILADDMGLGKTLQTLAWLAWLKEQNKKNHKPSLVICPASVLHNWRREAERFTPDLKVLVLESGAARHNLRKQIPQHDIIVTNYALLRRDLEELQKFAFRAVILDEAQFIKNPGAQVTHSVKQFKCEHRLALTGTPLENRLLDLWSIVDFIQPGYLGNQEQFLDTYEPRAAIADETAPANQPRGEKTESVQRIARKRLSAKLRPLLLRRLKKHVAKDLPDRIEERRDCPLGDEQRKLYLAELRRSRDQVMKVVEQQGINKSKMHVLAALTRLRQICCHPSLVGSDTASGKTDTLFELLDPLVADGQKVLVFSQFVQMLELLEKDCAARNIHTHMLTGQTKDRQRSRQRIPGRHRSPACSC